MKKDPLVSVIIPTYKRPETLSRSIVSVLNQSYRNIEVIVVDDNDPNSNYRLATEILMSEFSSNNKVIYLKHPQNINGSAARNTGLRYARGKYIAFLDDDDEFLSEKIEHQVTCLESRDISWGACYTKYVSKTGDKLCSILSEGKEGDLLIDALMRNLFLAGGSNLLIRRTVYEDIGGFDEGFIRNQDLEFLVRILEKYKLAYVNILGVIIHMHPVNRNLDFNKVTNDFLDSFKCYISELPEKQRSMLHLMIRLQLFRYNLFIKKDIICVLRMYFLREIPFVESVKYSIHLLYRWKTKKAFGYNLER